MKEINWIFMTLFTVFFLLPIGIIIFFLISNIPISIKTLSKLGALGLISPLFFLYLAYKVLH